MSETTTVATYVGAETQVLSAANGVDYAFRAMGASDGTPLVTFQHFRGNLDNWDPALIDALARGRRVITFDNRGVAASTGTTPRTIAQMALDAIDFIDALGVAEVDLLGFSIGSFVAQEMDSDPMILPRYSHLLAGLIPQARLKIYADAAHGFLFQHHAEFAADVDTFLASA